MREQVNELKDSIRTLRNQRYEEARPIWRENSKHNSVEFHLQFQIRGNHGRATHVTWGKENSLLTASAGKLKLLRGSHVTSRRSTKSRCDGNVGRAAPKKDENNRPNSLLVTCVLRRCIRQVRNSTNLFCLNHWKLQWEYHRHRRYREHLSNLRHNE